MTDPVLSSFAGRNPPNPVLAVTSGRLELEFDPEDEQLLQRYNPIVESYLSACSCWTPFSVYC